MEEEEDQACLITLLHEKQKENILWIDGVCRLFVRLFLQGTGSYSTSHHCISQLGIISVRIEKVQHPGSPFEMFYSL